MKSADMNARFSHLCQVAEVVILIPHSNAAEERIFSPVSKNKTQNRPNFAVEDTLGSILTKKNLFSTNSTVIERLKSC